MIAHKVLALKSDTEERSKNIRERGRINTKAKAAWLAIFIDYLVGGDSTFIHFVVTATPSLFDWLRPHRAEAERPQTRPIPVQLCNRVTSLFIADDIIDSSSVD